MVPACDAGGTMDGWTNAEEAIRVMVVAALESRGWSAHALSKASGVDRRVIDRLLSRTRCPMVDTLARIADALGMALPVGGATAIAVARGGSASRVAEDEPLTDFLAGMRELGLDAWLATAGKAETPSVMTTVAAVRALREAKPYSRESGAPIEGWGAWFKAFERNGYRLAETSKRGTSDARAKVDLGDTEAHEKLTATPPPKGRKR